MLFRTAQRADATVRALFAIIMALVVVLPLTTIAPSQHPGIDAERKNATDADDDGRAPLAPAQRGQPQVDDAQNEGEQEQVERLGGADAVEQKPPQRPPAWAGVVWRGVIDAVQLITGVALVVTLFYTRKAVLAAQAGNAILRAEQRPWLGIGTPRFSGFFNNAGLDGGFGPGDAEFGFKVTVPVRNTGSMPARQVRISIGLVELDSPDDTDAGMQAIAGFRQHPGWPGESLVINPHDTIEVQRDQLFVRVGRPVTPDRPRHARLVIYVAAQYGARANPIEASAVHELGVDGFTGFSPLLETDTFDFGKGLLTRPLRASST